MKKKTRKAFKRILRAVPGQNIRFSWVLGGVAAWLGVRLLRGRGIIPERVETVMKNSHLPFRSRKESDVASSHAMNH